MSNFSRMGGFAPIDVSNSHPYPLLDTERIYFVPYRWLKEVQESSVGNMEEETPTLFMATSSSSYASPMQIITNIFTSDLFLNLRREENTEQTKNSEDGVSGCDYALIPEGMWLQTLKRHNDSEAVRKSVGNLFVDKDNTADVYPLRLRLSFMIEGNQLRLTISKKENGVDFYRRACKIFSAESEPIRIWDFSGRTNLYFVNEKNRTIEDSQSQPDQEILLELQVYWLSDTMECRSEGMKGELGMQQAKTEVSSSFLGSIMSDDDLGNIGSKHVRTNSPTLIGSSGGIGSLGLTGLQNLGNTCFMNSAIQCLAHTPKLVEYFLGDYDEEINQENPLGMNGELALAFGDLLRKLWAPGRTPVAPRLFKLTLSHFAPQFSGFNQHDSQELLAFLLDGLHEDLNRVKCKPYIEAKDADGRSDEEVGNEYWANHLARNDSIIVDLFQGQYRSTLVCPFCVKTSVTFDPFMYLSLPLPSATMRTMTVTVISTDGGTQPSPFTITVPKNGKCKDLIQTLSSACSLRSNESLLVAEIYSSRIIRYLEEPSDSLSLIRDDDQLAAYRLPNDLTKFPMVVFMHQHMEEHYINGKITSCWKTFGIPFVTRLCNVINGSDIHNLFLKLLNPFLRPEEAAFDGQDNNVSDWNVEDIDMDNATNVPVSDGENPSSESADERCPEIEFELYLTDEKGITKYSKIDKDHPVSVMELERQLHVLVLWPEKTISHYDTRLINSLPQIFKPGFFGKRPQESVSLYTCLEAFLKEEPLGPEDMWYCPNCKKHQQATKKLDLWRLPEIFVIHLKRFSYSQFIKNKLETFVDFPIYGLELSSYIAHKQEQMSNCYALYAHQGDNQWYEFDDSHVFPVAEDKIKTSAAYVLFYRRIRASNLNT